MAVLKHVSFLTADAQAVIDFYGLLGAEVLKDLTTDEGLRRVVLGFSGGGKLQFFQASAKEPLCTPAGRSILRCTSRICRAAWTTCGGAGFTLHASWA